jgi:opacity protein-like surface antigen
MKKIVLIVLGIVLTYGVSNAQVRFGVKASGTLSKITEKIESLSAKTDPKFGFEVGGLLEYSFSESLSLQPELLFVNNGGKEKEEGEEEGISYKTTTTTTLNQLQLPIYLKYKVGSESLKFYGAAGPYFGYIFSAKEKGTGSIEGIEGLDISGTTDLFEEEILKHFDFGIGVGLGLELSNKYLVGVGYKYGIANLYPKDFDATYKVGTFNLSVGFLF